MSETFVPPLGLIANGVISMVAPSEPSPFEGEITVSGGLPA